MSAKSTVDRYGTVAITLHWLSALLILGLMIAGFIAAGADSVSKAAILRIHVPIGVAVLVLTLARIAWWLFADQKAVVIAGLPRLQLLAAKAVHILLYVAVIGLAGSGIAMIAQSGAGEVLFGSNTGPLPDFWNFAPRYGHAAAARLMVLLLAAHVGAALYHQFIRKDRLLARMGIGK